MNLVEYSGSVNGLREFRKKAELTQANLARLTDKAVSQGMISAHENDKKHITDPVKLKIISTILNCKSSDIAYIGEDGDPIEILDISEQAILSAIHNPTKRKKVARHLETIRLELTE
jgi:hypothetical protein